MASLSASKRRHRGRIKNYYSVQFSSAIAGAPRKALWLGFCSKEEAETHKNLVQRILQFWTPQLQLPSPILTQLDALPPRLRAKYERLGLCRIKQPPRTVGDLIAHFQATQKVTPATMNTYKQACDSLLQHIPRATGLTAITPHQATAWRESIAAQLAPATCAKRVNVLKCMFTKAVTWGWIGTNPFQGIVSGSQRNPARLHYVSSTVADKLIAASRTPEWKAIIALARFGGLRVPSELAVLEWGHLDITDPQSPRLQVYAQKTRLARIVPVRPQLLSALRELQACAAPGEARMFPRLSATTNLRTGFLKVLRRAKVEPWPRLLQNMRASAATDWVQKFPQHEVAGWLGHSPEVARDHYLMPLSTNFQAATSW